MCFMDQQGRAVQWGRLAAVRSPLMVLMGLAFLCVSAFLWAPVAGWAAIGVSLILLAYLTDGPTGGARR